MKRQQNISVSRLFIADLGASGGFDMSTPISARFAHNREGAYCFSDELTKSALLSRGLRAEPQKMAILSSKPLHRYRACGEKLGIVVERMAKSNVRRPHRRAPPILC